MKILDISHIMKMEVHFFELQDKSKPVMDFLLNLDYKSRVKATAVIQLLEEKGHTLREPFSKKLDAHIYELRIRQGTNYLRILYFFAENNTVYLTNGFVKKTDKTPRNELKKANRYREIFITRSKRI